MLLATALALASAGLHAGWNLLVKTSGDRSHAVWGQWVFGSLIFLPVPLLIGLPDWRATVPYLSASAVIHVVYLTALVSAFAGDFSLTYPLARGSGAVVAAVGGVLFLDDVLGALAWVAIAVVAVGLLSLVGPAVDGRSIRWALLTGLTIGVYTNVDAAGARLSDGFAYGIATSTAGAVARSVWGAARGEAPAFARSVRSNWRRYLVAGFGMTLAYSLVMVAVAIPEVPVGYVAILRESSVVLGAAIGWIVLKERLGRRRLVSSLVITGGLALLVAAR